jgi:hypothetical protein
MIQIHAVRQSSDVVNDQVVLQPERRGPCARQPIDSDPFVDFAYGFITGDTPQMAVALAEAGSKAETQRRKPSLAVAAVGEKMMTKSVVSRQQFPLRKKSLPQRWGQIAGGENFPEGRDARFIKTLMPQLQGHSLVMLAGHGYPGEIVGGPT